MRLNTIELLGFGPYKDYVKVNIPMGLTGILATINGIEGKSNGGGKSALVGAIPFALYGVGTFDKTGEVWNDKLPATADAFVKLNFDLTGNNYIVERGRKGKGSYLDVFENGTRIGDSIKEAQEFINTLLNMEDKLFVISVFFFQGEMDSFIKTEPKTRKEYIDMILGLERWRNALKLSNRKYKETQTETETVLQDITNTKNSLVDTDVSIRTIETSLESMPLLQAKREAQLLELEKVKAVAITRKRLSDYQTELGKTESVKSTAESNLRTAQATQKNISNDYENAINNFKAFESIELPLLTSAVASGETDIGMLQNTIEILQIQIKATTLDITDAKADINSFTSGKNKLKAGTCVSCKQAVTEEYISKHESEIDAEIVTASKKHADVLALHQTQQARYDIKFKELSDLKQSIQQQKETISNYKQASATLNAAELRFKRDVEINSSTIVATTAQIAKFEVEINDLKDKVEETTKQLPAGITTDVATLTRQITEIDKTIEELTIKKGVLVKYQEEQEKLKNTLENSETRLKNLKEFVYYLEVLIEAFKEIPTALLKESVVEIENYANEILSSILPRYRIRLYEDEEKQNRPLMIAFIVDGKYRNYKRLSGGQQAICATSLRIGFNKIIARKAKVSLNFLVLDEIFGALDEVNRAEVLKMLGGLLKYFPQILIITHTEEASLFPNTIHIDMDSQENSYIR